MPIPKPIGTDTEEEYMSRCISFLVNEGTEQEQAVAICATNWEERKMKNTTNTYQIKGAFEIKDLNLAAREVAMYVSKFDVIDSDKDLIRRGAFAKSIAERGPQSAGNRKIAFLRHHNWEMQIGKAIKMEEDSNGLFVVSQLGNSTMGNDAFEDYKDGIIREHSIGFKYIGDKMKWVEGDTPDKGYFEISELALWEYSAVTFGANQYTNVVEVAKGAEKADMAIKLSEEINVVAKALANGQGTDDRLYQLEMKLKFLNARMLDLAITEPSNVKPTHSAETIGGIKDAFDWSKVITNIKI
jgi:HK97 family phage prohead protease